jgi:hypothetical protein
MYCYVWRCVAMCKVRILQGYIFSIWQHFVTKLCNFTYFSMLFLAVVIYLHFFGEWNYLFSVSFESLIIREHFSSSSAHLSTCWALAAWLSWKTNKKSIFSISREKCSKPKIFLAFLSKLLCFSFNAVKLMPYLYSNISKLTVKFGHHFLFGVYHLKSLHFSIILQIKH